MCVSVRARRHTQCLLVKNPERRITWPDLALHPFVCDDPSAVFVPDSVEIRNSVMQLPPTQHPEKGRKNARGVRQNTPPPGAELPALAGGAGAPAAVEPGIEPEPAPQPAARARVKTPPPPIEQAPQQVAAPAVSASTEALDAEWSQLAEQTMDHDFASRSIDQRDLGARNETLFSSGE
jgi:hypothetical protein